MLDLLPLVVRILVAYIYLLGIVRLSGKRSIGQATPADFVISIIIGDMIDDLLWAEVPASQFVVGVGTIILIDLLLLVLTSRSARMFLAIEGGFPVLVRDGVPQVETMRREQINDQDLEHLLRTKDVEPKTVAQVHLGTLEQDGHLSVLKKPASRDADRRDARSAKRRRRTKSP